MEVASRELKKQFTGLECQSRSRSLLNAAQHASQARRAPKEPVLQNEVPSLPLVIVAVDLFDHARETNLVIVESYSGYIDFKMQQVEHQQMSSKH